MNIRTGVRIAGTIATLGLIAGCATPMPKAGPGMVVTKTQEAVGAGPAEKADKTGEVCQQNFLGVATIGDASVEAAKKEGNIDTIHSIDSDILGFLGLYAQNCVIVRGQ